MVYSPYGVLCGLLAAPEEDASRWSNSVRVLDLRALARHLTALHAAPGSTWPPGSAPILVSGATWREVGELRAHADLALPPVEAARLRHSAGLSERGATAGLRVRDFVAAPGSHSWVGVPLVSRVRAAYEAAGFPGGGTVRALDEPSPAGAAFRASLYPPPA